MWARVAEPPSASIAAPPPRSPRLRSIRWNAACADRAAVPRVAATVPSAATVLATIRVVVIGSVGLSCGSLLYSFDTARARRAVPAGSTLLPTQYSKVNAMLMGLSPPQYSQFSTHHQGRNAASAS